MSESPAESKRIKLLNDQNKYEEFILERRTTSSKADLYLYTIPEENFTSVMIHYKTRANEKTPLKFLYTAECKEAQNKEKLLWADEDIFRKRDQERKDSDLELISEDMEIFQEDVHQFCQNFNQMRIKFDSKHKNCKYFVNELLIAFSLPPKYTFTKVEKESWWESVSRSSSSCSSWKNTNDVLKSFLRGIEAETKWLQDLFIGMKFDQHQVERLVIKLKEEIGGNIKSNGFTLSTLFITLTEVLLSEIDQNFWEKFNLDENTRKTFAFIVPKLLGATFADRYIALFWLVIGLLLLIFKKISERYNLHDLFGGEADYERFFQLCEKVLLPLTQSLYQHWMNSN